MSAVWVGELFFVKDVLDQGDTSYGVFLSVWTAGMAIGALFLSKRVAAGAVAAVGLAAATIQGARARRSRRCGSRSGSSSPARSSAASGMV